MPCAEPLGGGDRVWQYPEDQIAYELQTEHQLSVMVLMY